MDACLERCSGYVPPGGEPEEDPGHMAGREGPGVAPVQLRVKSVCFFETNSLKLFGLLTLEW